MSTTTPRLRKSTKQIPDQARPPLKHQIAEVLYNVPKTHLDRTRNVQGRSCSEATFVLELCQSGGELSEVPTLISNLPGWVTKEVVERCLRNALTSGNVEVSRLFLDEGALLTANDVLALAQRWMRSVEMYELFLEYGWDVNQPSSRGDTLLSWVVDDEDLVRWLLSKKANPNFGRSQPGKYGPDKADDESGFALERAALECSIPVFTLLIEAGAQLDFGAPLHEAVWSPQTDAKCFVMMECLLSMGIYIDAMDHIPRGGHGFGSPLMCLVKYGDSAKIERARWLLEHGADPSLKNWRGISPLDEANRIGRTAFLDIFAEFYPSIERTDVQG